MGRYSVVQLTGKSVSGKLASRTNVRPHRASPVLIVSKNYAFSDLSVTVLRMYPTRVERGHPATSFPPALAAVGNVSTL